MCKPQPAVYGQGLLVIPALCLVNCAWAAIDQVQPFAKVYTHFI